MKVIVKDFLNVRVGAPSVNAPCYQYLVPGTEVEVDGILYTGDFFEDTNIWMRDASNNYFWEGGLERAIDTDSNIASLFFDYNTRFKNIPKHIRESRGESIKVAVLDTGIYETHPDFSGAFINDTGPSVDLTNSTTGTTDKKGHGTHVAGLIGARSDDRFGIVGVAPACSIRNIKVLNDAGDSSGATLLMGLREAKKVPVDIINLSLSIPFSQYRNIQMMFEDLAKHTVIVASAGNDNTLLKDDILFPAMSPFVISIGAISKKFIETNPNPKFNKRVDYLLPEIALTSCAPKEKFFYVNESGSSMSAALLSGLVALIMKGTGNKSITHIKSVLDDIAISYNQQIESDSITLIKPV